MARTTKRYANILYKKVTESEGQSSCGDFLVCFICIIRVISNVINAMITKIIEHNISINEINTLTSIKIITSIRQFIFVYLKTTANSSKKELAHHLCSPHIYMACKMENDFKKSIIFIT